MMQHNEAQIIELTQQRRPAPQRKTKARRIVAIGGGKGGVGKSLISASLGIALAQRDSEVVLVDADLGGANLHTCLGIQQPHATLSDFIDRRVPTMQDLMVSTGIKHLSFLAGAMDSFAAANPKHTQKEKLLRHLKTLDVDFVLLDLGAGTNFNVMDFFLTADVGIVVMLPEPTSIENAYRFIKAAFFRRLQAEAPTKDFAAKVSAAMAPGAGKPARSPWELVTDLKPVDAMAAVCLEHTLRCFHPLIVINQARARIDYDVGPKVALAWRKFFGIELGYLGSISQDDAVWQAARTSKVLMRAFPACPAAKDVLRLTENLVELES